MDVVRRLSDRALEFKTETPRSLLKPRVLVDCLRARRRNGLSREYCGRLDRYLNGFLVLLRRLYLCH